MRQLGMLHCSLERLVVQAIELERKEQELRGNGGDLLLDVAEEFLPPGIRGVGGVEQARVGDNAAEEVVELLELAHRLGKSIAALPAVEQARELARVALLHGIRRP